MTGKTTTPLTRRRALGAGAVALTTAATLVPRPAMAQTVTRLKIQTAVPTSSIYFDLMKKFGDRCDKMSNGRLKMEMLPDGAVVNAFEMLDAVDKGVVDGGYSWTHYWSGKNTAAGLFSNPAGRRRHRHGPALARRVADAGRRQRALQEVLRRRAEVERRAVHDPADGP
jgi:TRAP-type mannitol/chloroaromatic compound transport system substrate-binding protein